MPRRAAGLVSSPSKALRSSRRASVVTILSPVAVRLWEELDRNEDVLNERLVRVAARLMKWAR